MFYLLLLDYHFSHVLLYVKDLFGGFFRLNLNTSSARHANAINDTHTKRELNAKYTSMFYLFFDVAYATMKRAINMFKSNNQSINDSQKHGKSGRKPKRKPARSSGIASGRASGQGPGYLVITNK